MLKRVDHGCWCSLPRSGSCGVLDVSMLVDVQVLSTIGLPVLCMERETLDVLRSANVVHGETNPRCLA
eukprot:2913592-Amphidinium_carterae.1